MSQILSIRNVLSHAQANGINATMMQLIEIVKELLIGVGEWLLFVWVLHGPMLLKEGGKALSKLCSNRPHFAGSSRLQDVQDFSGLHVNPV